MANDFDRLVGDLISRVAFISHILIGTPICLETGVTLPSSLYLGAKVDRGKPSIRNVQRRVSEFFIVKKNWGADVSHICCATSVRAMSEGSGVGYPEGRSFPASHIRSRYPGVSRGRCPVSHLCRCPGEG